MDPLLIVLTIVLSILAVILAVAGIQVILVLQEVKRTLTKVNSVADTIENSAIRSLSSVQNLGGMIDGVRGGLKVMQAFVGWLNKDGK